MRSVTFVCAAAVLVLGCERVRLRTQEDAGPVCGPTERLVNGQCLFVCQRDGDCLSGERCDLFTGKCVARDLVDASVPEELCTEGAVRCSSDNHAVESCQADGGWSTTSTCPPPDGYCQNEICLACRPGSAKCVAGQSNQLNLCKDDGSAFRLVTCAGAATCQQNECRECAPGAKRCSPDGKNVQECKRQPREDLTWGWTNVGDNFDGSCITQQCLVTGGVAACKAPDCVPGATQCKNSTTQQTCGATGTYTDQVCSALSGFGPNSECVGGACVDECADAVRAKSYYGCEYWGLSMDNSVDTLFKGGTTSGQGTGDSDFVFVVTNQSISPAVVTVQRFVGSAAVTVKTVPVPGRNDAATHGLVKIPVPWQSVTPAGTSSNPQPIGVGITGRARYGYRLTSTKPITVYQFSPIDAVKYTKSCNGTAGQIDCSCNEMAGYLGMTGCLLGGSAGDTGTCTQTSNGKKCAYFTFSNDASLLLPAHILGTSYVALSSGTARYSGPPPEISGGQVVILATQDNTQVTVKVAGPVVAGSGIAAMNKGDTRMFTLQSYEVLQLTAGTGANLECVGAGALCRLDSDLTGTIVSSDKPVAVFGGHPCDQLPYDKPACDHVEEQIFPFATWGKTFVAVPPAPLRLTGGGLSGTPPAFYKIVAGCPLSQCPNGTLLTVNPPPAANAVLAPVGCIAGTSLSANNCRLPGGAFAEFQATVAMTISGDQPIAVAQFFTGEQAVAGSATQGDPSMVMLPPSEQWRARYTVLASTGLQDNFLGLSIDSAKVQSVLVDGVAVTGFQNVGTTTFQFKNQPVATGTHTIQVNAKPGQTTVPGAGVTVYGYDSYVSYGYTGGLDLSSIVTGINPGG